jgi:UDP-N-acetylglucosamine 2-epimerase (non-hydrolysing)
MVPIMVVAGTRPEAIKLSPVIQWLQKLRVDTVLAWSGQHYDYELSEVFFKQLDLPRPDVDLHVGSGSHAEQTGKAMIRLEKTIAQYKPSLVVAEGDTNTVATVALTAMKTRVPFAHLEAGLRSYDRTMPEEINRIVADSLSELLFAPTKLAFMNLTHEGIPFRKIRLTGNTVVDVVIEHRDTAGRTGIELLKELNISSCEYLLVTLHRQENTDSLCRLSSIVKALLLLSEKHKIVFPMHPRTKDKLQSAGMYETLKRKENLILIPPQGYFEFLGLLMHSLVVLTDSGGVQEEALTLGIPTVTLRYNTERPETVLCGINVVAGTEPESVCKLTERQIQKSAQLRNNVKVKPNPFGGGNAGRKVAIAIKNAVEAGIEVEASDTRHDPYIVYALVNSDQLKNIDDSFEILAIYNQAGYAQLPAKNKHFAVANGKILVRAPLKAIMKLRKRHKS